MRLAIIHDDVEAVFRTVDSVLAKYNNRLGVPDEIKGEATLASLKHTFSPDKWFSVCYIESLAKMNNVVIPRDLQNLFSSLHCVSYSDMTPTTREYIVARCLDLFRENIHLTGKQNEPVTAITRT